MPGRVRIDFDSLQDEIIVLLHQGFWADLPAFFLKDIAEPLGWPKNVVEMALPGPIQSGNITVHTAESAIGVPIPGLGKTYKISRSGIDFVNQMPDKKYETVVSKLKGLGQKIAVPASNLDGDVWEPNSGRSVERRVYRDG